MLPLMKSSDLSKHAKKGNLPYCCNESLAGSMSIEGCIADAIEFSRRGHREQTLGNHVDALKWMEKSLAIVEKLLPNSPEVAVILSSIGVMYQQAGIDSGYSHQMRALMIRQRDQPGTTYVAESHEYVGLSLLSEHKYEDALNHFLVTLGFYESKNPSSFIVALNHFHIGRAKVGMGQVEEAIISFQKALSIMISVNPESLDVANVHASLGRAQHNAGHYVTAKQHLYQAVALYDAHLPESMEISNIYVELGIISMLEKAGYDEALSFFSKALEIQNSLAPNSLDIANTYHQLAVLHQFTGNCDICRGFVLRAISIREKLAPLSLDLAQSLFFMGNLLSREDRLEQALKLHSRALELRSTLRPLKIEEAESLHTMGMLSEKMGDWESALGYYSREFLVRDINDSARIHNRVGNVLVRLPNRAADAVFNLRMAVQIQSKNDKEGLYEEYLLDLISGLNGTGLVSADKIRKLEQFQQTMEPIPEHIIDDVCRLRPPGFSQVKFD